MKRRNILSLVITIIITAFVSWCLSQDGFGAGWIIVYAVVLLLSFTAALWNNQYFLDGLFQSKKARKQNYWYSLIYVIMLCGLILACDISPEDTIGIVLSFVSLIGGAIAMRVLLKMQSRDSDKD